MPTPPMPPDQLDLIHCLLRRRVKQRVVAARAGVSLRTISRIVASLDGVPRPFDVEYDARYLNQDERCEIARLHDLKWSMRAT